MSVKQPSEPPRPLKASEIESIIQRWTLGDVFASTERTALAVLDGIKTRMRADLRSICLCPDAIEELADTLADLYRRALSQPGEAVGPVGASAAAQPLTQGALSSFKVAGSDLNVTHGVKVLKEIFSGAGTRPCSKMHVALVGETKNFDRQTLCRAIVPELQEIMGRDLFGAWRVIDCGVQQGCVCELRIAIGVLSMLKLRVRPSEIAAAIRNTKLPTLCQVWFERSNTQTGTAFELCVRPKHSEIVESAFMASPDDAERSDLVSERLCRDFVELVAIQALSLMRVRGIAGFSNPKVQFVDGLRSASWRRLPNKYAVYVPSERNFVMHGVTPNISEQSLTFCAKTENTNVSDWRQIYTHKQAEERLRRIVGETRACITASAGLFAPYFARPWSILSKGQIPVPFGVSFVESEGGSLYDVASRWRCDPDRSSCNDLNQMVRMLGVEAVRTLLLDEFISILGNEGSELDFRHVALLVDQIVRNGNIVGVTQAALSRGQPNQVFSAATTLKSMDQFRSVAAVGGRDDLRSASAAVVYGKMLSLGTGSFGLIFENNV